MNLELTQYIDQWRSSLVGEPWIDETFAKKLEMVNEETAFLQPLPRVHSVAQLVSHLIEWQLSIFNIWKGGRLGHTNKYYLEGNHLSQYVSSGADRTGIESA